MTSQVLAFLAFLNCEAKLAEDRAKSLRETAAAIEANSNEGTRSPIGRKNNNKRKRASSSKTQKAKRQQAPTAYSLFVQENYEEAKRTLQQQQGDHLEFSSQDIMSVVAQQWAQINDTEKQMWQFRADQLNNNNLPLPVSMAAEAPSTSTANPLEGMVGVDGHLDMDAVDVDDLPELPNPTDNQLLGSPTATATGTRKRGRKARGEDVSYHVAI